MRICMTTSEFPPVVGGISHYVYKLSKRLTERGHEVKVVTRGSYKGLSIDYFDNIRVYRVPYMHVYPIHVKLHQLFQNRLLKSLEDEFDIIHLHHPLIPLFRTSLPTVVTVHTSLGPSIESQNFYATGPKLPIPLLRLMRWYFSQLERSLVENADRVTVVSNAVADELRVYYPKELAQRPQIEILGNGVDTGLFAPGVTSEQTRILYTGRLAWNKGLEDFVKAAQLILQRRNNVSFIITGEGPIKPYLEHVVREMMIADKFSFPGYLELQQLIRCYQTTTIFVYPSRYEGLPTSLLEAMACGVPVVATGIGCIPEIVHNNENGIIVPMSNPTAIANAVLYLLEDDDSRLRMGQAARKTVEQDYDWDRIVDRVERCYEMAIEAKAAMTGG